VTDDAEAPGGRAANAETADARHGAAPDAGRQTCPWCAAPAAPTDTRCTACGAALAQRESIGDLVIPGLTTVDPALQDFDKRPLHLRGPSPSQGMASGAIVAAAAGGPIGLAALGGIAAVAAAEYLAASRDGSNPVALEAVGKPSEAVLQALERIERGDESAAGSPTPQTEDAATRRQAGVSGPEDFVDHTWDDLPPVDHG
jgi:hypothetical protein